MFPNLSDDEVEQLSLNPRHSRINLDLLVTAEDSGLLDVLLDGAVATTCSARFPALNLAADATVDLQLSHAGQSYESSLLPSRF